MSPNYVSVGCVAKLPKITLQELTK